MKILQLCKKFPYPLKDGESIAVTYLSKAMVDLGNEVTLLSMNTTKHYADVDALKDEINHYKNIYVTDLDNSVNPIDAFVNLFTKESYHVSRFVSKAFETKLIEVLQSEDFDVVQLETLYLTPYIDTIKKYSKAIIAMRAHNIEFEIWERITENSGVSPKKWYLNLLTKKLKNYELTHLNDYDYLITVSDRDLKKFKHLGYKNGAMSSPIGLKISDYESINPKSDDSGFCFIGALDWMPNLEGLDWFLQNVWPIVHEKNPSIKFHIAGRHTPPQIKNLRNKNVVVHGEVPNARLFIGRFPLMVVPLFSGSGMRVKILEGMAMSKAIVTTKIGLEGINAENGKHIVIADEAKQFANEILRLMSDSAQMKELGLKGQEFVKTKYDNDSNARKLINKYEALLSSPAYAK